MNSLNPSESLKVLPWQTQQWEQLLSSRQQNRLSHALLLVGAQGLGKKQFALKLAEALLCSQSDGPCGQCHACHLIRAQSHPDFLLVEAETGSMIKIDQIRELVQFVGETALQASRRVIIINPANAMNVYAANALLKTLEEPAPNTIIILITDQNMRMPATIISRCQKIHFQKPSQDIAIEWLKSNVQENSNDAHLLLNLADGAPLKAKELIDNGFFELRQTLYQGLNLLSQRQADPLQLASELQEHDTITLLNLLLIWLQDILRFKLTDGQSDLINSDYHATFAKLMQTLSRDKIIDYFDQVKKAYEYIQRSLNLNRQLMLEELFIRWTQYAAR